MSDVEALLLIGPDGRYYIFRGGIGGYSGPSNYITLSAEEIRKYKIRADDGSDPVKEFHDNQRTIWFSQRSEEEHPNKGPFILQAFNILIEEADDEDNGVTANSGSVSGL